MNLRDAGEAALIRTIREKFSSTVQVGIGDDAAVFDLPPGRSAVFCSDLLAENTHFLRQLHPPASIGHKAVVSNVSDVAAMGGTPLYFLISLALPPDLPWTWFDEFLQGVDSACCHYGVSLLGGDSSSAESIFVDVAMIGAVRVGGAVRRSGARPGDGIYVTGMLGSSALGLQRLRTGLREDPAVQRHLFPEARHRVGPAVADRAHAMIDISDGLSTDLGHVIEESKVSARIYKHLLPAAPGTEEEHVLHGGEEYELVIVAPELPSIVEGVPLTRIGEIIESGVDRQIYLIDGSSESVLQPRGWEHF